MDIRHSSGRACDKPQASVGNVARRSPGLSALRRGAPYADSSKRRRARSSAPAFVGVVDFFKPNHLVFFAILNTEALHFSARNLPDKIPKMKGYSLRLVLGM